MTIWYAYTKEDIRNNFQSKDYTRGLSYARSGMVKSINLTGDGKLTAQVYGSRSTPYKVELQIEATGKRKTFRGYCSCPVQFMCKHAAAALLEGIKMIPADGFIDVTPQAGRQDSIAQPGTIHH